MKTCGAKLFRKPFRKPFRNPTCGFREFFQRPPLFRQTHLDPIQKFFTVTLPLGSRNLNVSITDFRIRALVALWKPGGSLAEASRRKSPKPQSWPTHQYDLIALILVLPLVPLN